MAHTRVRRLQQQVLKDLEIGGVLLSGALAYDCYPSAAGAVGLPTVTSNTDGAYQTIVAASAIAAPYHFCGFSGMISVASTFGTIGRIKVREIGQSNPFWEFEHPKNSNATGYINGWTRTRSGIYRLPANAGVEALSANSTGALTETVYGLVLRRQPAYMAELARHSGSNRQRILREPTTTPAGLMTNAGSAWVWGSYVPMTAGYSTPVVITAVSAYVSANANSQFSLATGAGGAEIDVGIFGGPTVGTTGGVGYQIDLPYGIFIPANTRIAMRSRSAVGSTAVYCAYEYYTVPLGLI